MEAALPRAVSCEGKVSRWSAGALRRAVSCGGRGSRWSAGGKYLSVAQRQAGLVLELANCPWLHRVSTPYIRRIHRNGFDTRSHRERNTMFGLQGRVEQGPFKHSFLRERVWSIQ